ncbi:unnamed protein product [Symbiodinium necroappetens]|uniref:Uncharacterized protein n=1 Tax=Symbiodinium necroappetens TaxID=1628268 RepID=A0A812T3X6_9DINO|nr:unnamed protein product [Symbiodinium necroappetens]
MFPVGTGKTASLAPAACLVESASCQAVLTAMMRSRKQGQPKPCRDVAVVVRPWWWKTSCSKTNRQSLIASDVLEEDLRRLQVNYQKLQEQDDSEEDEEGEGSERKPKRKSRKCSSIRDVDEVVPDEEISDPDLHQQADEIEELRQALRTAQREAAKQLQTLEAEVESKKQEVEERRAAEQVAKSSAAQSESKCKVLQERLQVMAEENDKTERE